MVFMKKYDFTYNKLEQCTVIGINERVDTYSREISAVDIKSLESYETLKTDITEMNYFTGRYPMDNRADFKVIYKYYKIMG